MSEEWKRCPFLCELRDLEIDGTSKVIGYICKGQCQGCQARRPAEEELKEEMIAEVERLKSVIAEIAATLATGAEISEDDIFTICKDAVGEKAVLDRYNEKLRERVGELENDSDR